MSAVLDTITRCSFCTKDEAEVAQMVAGAGVYICNECVSLCNDIFAIGKRDTEEAAIPYWRSMTDEELLAQLPRIASVATQVEDNLQVWRRRSLGTNGSSTGRSTSTSTPPRSCGESVTARGCM
jgi:hypothetical protein